MASHWEEFYTTHPPPADFEDSKKQLGDFCTRQQQLGQKIVLITSGGTTVPIEHNTVRFVDNFSAGNRGSASAEYFLKMDYAVIFLFRLKSLEPFVRHFMGQRILDVLLDVMEPTEHTSTQLVNPEVMPILAQYKVARDGQKLLSIPFTTLTDYLWLLRAASESLSPFRSAAMLYLAAAVSDFYIPHNEMPEHKLQSSEGPPTISLRIVPKMLEPLVSLWAPLAFIVSFKLETDEGLLISKARAALSRYKHQLVIANMLTTRKSRVVLVTAQRTYEIQVTKEEQANGTEIESKIVADVVSKHHQFQDCFK